MIPIQKNTLPLKKKSVLDWLNLYFIPVMLGHLQKMKSFFFPLIIFLPSARQETLLGKTKKKQKQKPCKYTDHQIYIWMRAFSCVFLVRSTSHFNASLASLGTMKTSHPIIKQHYLTFSFLGRIFFSASLPWPKCGFSVSAWLPWGCSLCWHHVVKACIKIRCSQRTSLLCLSLCCLMY